MANTSSGEMARAAARRILLSNIAETAKTMNWEDGRVIVLLCQFLARRGLTAKAEEYIRAAARNELEEAEARR